MWSCTSPTATQFSSKERLFLSSTHPLIQYTLIQCCDNDSKLAAHQLLCQYDLLNWLAFCANLPIEATESSKVLGLCAEFIGVEPLQFGSAHYRYSKCSICCWNVDNLANIWANQ